MTLIPLHQPKHLKPFEPHSKRAGSVHRGLSPLDFVGTHGKKKQSSGHHKSGVHQSEPETQKHDRLVEQTQRWVAQTFYGTLLQQMRKSPFKDEKFEGGRGGEVFGAMFDQRLADNMSKSAGSKLVNAIVDSIEHPMEPKSLRIAAAQAHARPETISRPRLTDGAHQDSARAKAAANAYRNQSVTTIAKVRAHVAPGFGT